MARLDKNYLLGQPIAYQILFAKSKKIWLIRPIANPIQSADLAPIANRLIGSQSVFGKLILDLKFANTVGGTENGRSWPVLAGLGRSWPVHQTFSSVSPAPPDFYNLNAEEL